MSDLDDLRVEARFRTDLWEQEKARGDRLSEHAQACVIAKDSAEARLAETQKALERYGQHDANCNSEDGDPNYCTCGLRAALTTHPTADE